MCGWTSSRLERDDFSSNRHPALSFCLSMISAQTLRVCREGKPVPTFPDHALVLLSQKTASRRLKESAIWGDSGFGDRRRGWADGVGMAVNLDLRPMSKVFRLSSDTRIERGRCGIIAWG